MGRQKAWSDHEITFVSFLLISKHSLMKVSYFFLQGGPSSSFPSNLVKFTNSISQSFRIFFEGKKVSLKVKRRKKRKDEMSDIEDVYSLNCMISKSASYSIQL